MFYRRMGVSCRGRLLLLLDVVIAIFFCISCFGNPHLFGKVVGVGRSSGIGVIDYSYGRSFAYLESILYSVFRDILQLRFLPCTAYEWSVCRENVVFRRCIQILDHSRRKKVEEMIESHLYATTHYSMTSYQCIVLSEMKLHPLREVTLQCLYGHPCFHEDVVRSDILK